LISPTLPIFAGHILIIGGEGDSETELDTTELLDVAMEFAPGPAMQIARYARAAARIDVTEGRPHRHHRS
jgi:hypothetical protein